MSEEAPKQETKQELITAAKQLPPTEVFSLKPRTFDEAFRFANLIAESTLIPKEFQKNPANVLIAVQLGMELGVAPMQALQNIAVINGRPTIWGDLVPAIVYQSGLCEQFDEQGDEKLATCTVKRKGFAAITRTFSMDEARKVAYSEWIDNKKVQLTLADKQTYKSYPKRMLQMRARSYAMRDAFPDVLKGVHIREEIDDLSDEPRDVTPISTPQAIKETKADDRKEANPVDSGEPKNSGGVNSESSNTPGSNAEVPTKHTSTKKSQAPKSGAVQEEKSQDDIISECLLWIESAPEDQIAAEKDNWLLAQLPRLKGTQNQMAVLRPFNDRRHSLPK
jgi:hypothetical protein